MCIRDRYLSEDFEDADKLIELSKSPSKDIRYYSILNLAKLSDSNLLNFFEEQINIETTSRNRREIASAIGRLRSPNAKEVLIKLLKEGRLTKDYIQPKYSN